MSFAFKIARTDRNNSIVFDVPALTAFEQSIELARIDVVILDPFISFHNVPENDTGAMDAVVKRLGEVSARQRCNIELSHHVRKPSMGQAEITVYDARGAGSIVNAVRSCRVLNQMSKAVAEQLNPPIDDKNRHGISALTAANAIWHRQKPLIGWNCTMSKLTMVISSRPSMISNLIFKQLIWKKTSNGSALPCSNTGRSE